MPPAPAVGGDGVQALAAVGARWRIWRRAGGRRLKIRRIGDFISGSLRVVTARRRESDRRSRLGKPISPARHPPAS